MQKKNDKKEVFTLKSKLKDKKFEELTDEEIWSLLEEEAQTNFEGMLKKIREFSSERV